MDVVRWGPEAATTVFDPAALDALDGAAAVVLDGVAAGHDELLGWVRIAPAVVIAVAPEDGAASAAVDVVVSAADDLDAVIAACAERPQAARALVEVLRLADGRPVADALRIESLAYSMLLAGPEFRAWLSERPTFEPKEFAGPAVRLDRAGDVLTVTLARPENRNAFGAEMRDAVVDALRIAELDASIERVVLRGDGPTFSSGGDLGEFGTAPDVVRAHQIRSMHSVGATIDRLSARVEAWVQGACVGAGLELAAFADRVVATPDATFRLPEVAMGLIPGAGGTVSVARRAGRQAAAHLALTGATIDVGTAERLGLVDQVVDAHEQPVD